MGAFSLPIQPRTNPYLAEIDAAAKNAHAQLSPGAQEALKRAGAPVPGQPAAVAPTPQIASPAQSVKGIMPEEATEPGPEALAAEPSISAPTTGVPHAAAPPVIQPIPPTAAAGPAQAEMTRLAGSKAGVDQIKSPWARVPLQILAGLGETFAPRLAQALPGTESHHRMLLGEAENAVGEQEKIRENEEKARTAAATEGHLGGETAHNLAQAEQLIPAQATEAHARAWSLLNPQDKERELTEFALWHKQNPDAPVSEWIKLKAQEKTVPEGETPLGERVSQLNQALTSRYQVLHPKAPLPSQYQIPANATQKDYDRIDKAMEAEERATGTLAQQQEANAMRQQSYQLAAQGQATSALDRETQQYRTPHTKAVSDADAQLERIQEAKAMLSSGSAEAQAVAVPKVMTALISGAGSGVRITQPELNAIISARGLGGSFEAFMQRIQSGKKLTPEQSQQLQTILADAENKVIQKQQIHSEALDRIGGAGNRNDIIKADQEARSKLGALEKGGGGIKVQQNSKGEYRYSTDDGKTWQSGKPPQ
jgi:hypothetical protein